jgi:hypothetical protein
MNQRFAYRDRVRPRVKESFGNICKKTAIAKTRDQQTVDDARIYERALL